MIARICQKRISYPLEHGKFSQLNLKLPAAMMENISSLIEWLRFMGYKQKNKIRPNSCVLINCISLRFRCQFQCICLFFGAYTKKRTRKNYVKINVNSHARYIHFTTGIEFEPLANKYAAFINFTLHISLSSTLPIVYS